MHRPSYSGLPGAGRARGPLRKAVTTAVIALALSAATPAAASFLLTSPSPDAVPVDAPWAPVVVIPGRVPCGRDRVKVEVVRPAEPGARPAVLVLHGARPARALEHYREEARTLAAAGYTAILVHYYDRGRPGRGDRAAWRRTVSAVAAWAAGRDDVDGGRIGVVGYSLGAFLALAEAPRDPRIRAVVAYYGGATPGELDAAPFNRPPTLLLHGTADRVVPVRRATEAAALLRTRGWPVRLVVYRGAGHGFGLNDRGGADRRAAADARARTLAFLDRTLREGPEPSPGPVTLPPAEGAGALPAVPGTVRLASLPPGGDGFVLLDPAPSDLAAPRAGPARRPGSRHTGERRAAAAPPAGTSARGEPAP